MLVYTFFLTFACGLMLGIFGTVALAIHMENRDIQKTRAMFRQSVRVPNNPFTSSN